MVSPLDGIQHPHIVDKSVSAGQSAQVYLCLEVHWRTSQMSSSLLAKQCPVYLPHPIRMVYMIGGKRLYNCCFVGCCFQDLLKAAQHLCVVLM